MYSSYFTELSNSNIVIETDRLRIYKMTVSEKIFRDLFEIYSSETNVKNYCNRHVDFISSAAYLKNKIDRFQNELETLISFVIELKENSKIIGVRNFMLDIRTNHDGSIDRSSWGNIITEIIINENYWGKGFAFEASQEIFRLATDYHLGYALTFVPKNNLKSELLDRKLGFVEFTLDFIVEKFHFFEECIYNTMEIDKNKIFVRGLDSGFPYK